MKYVSAFFLTMLFAYWNIGIAQTLHVIHYGVIEYEKTDNMFALIKKKVTPSSMEYKPHYEEYLKTEPQFLKLKSTLTFSNNKTLFIPTPSAQRISYWYDSPMANQINIIYSDLDKKVSVIKKDFYERTYLVKDSLRKINWKLTDETRVIAGYTCRRANALILDSVYVVAFYTDEIHVSGGPESFNGLPGMILGVALPRENVTWYATRVTEQIVNPGIITPPVSGKIVNNRQLKDDIVKTINTADSYGMFLLKGLML